MEILRRVRVILDEVCPYASRSKSCCLTKKEARVFFAARANMVIVLLSQSDIAGYLGAATIPSMPSPERFTEPNPRLAPYSSHQANLLASTSHPQAAFTDPPSALHCSNHAQHPHHLLHDHFIVLPMPLDHFSRCMRSSHMLRKAGLKTGKVRTFAGEKVIIRHSL